MLSNTPVCATIATSDLGRARRFYGDGLGLEEVTLAADWVGYRAGDNTMIHVYERPGAPAEQTIATFLVTDIVAVVADLRNRGVEPVEYDVLRLYTDGGVFSRPDGFKAAWLVDPDGNTISIEQLPR